MRATAPLKPVTVSVVSHGQLHLLAPLIAQLNQYCAATVDKIVLTHNLRQDLSASPHSAITLLHIENEQPKGFGANHNAAFERCTTPWFLVLNPDIRLFDDVLLALLGQAAATSAMLTPRIYEPGSSTPEPHRRLITPLEIILRKRPCYQAPAQPAWIPGLLMLIRSDVYRQIGGFNAQRFFLYGEDVDLCARVRLAGWGIQAVEPLRVEHQAQRASHVKPKYLYWHLTSLIKLWLSPEYWRYRSLLARQAQAS